MGTRIVGLLVLVAAAVVVYFMRADGIHVDRPTIARADIMSLKTQLLIYSAITGSYPTTEHGLEALVRRPEPALQSWKPLLHEVPKDPWGQMYIYRRGDHGNGADIDVFSLGPDGIESADDIRGAKNDVAEQVSPTSDVSGWKLSAGWERTGRSVQRKARDLFAPELRMTPEQLRLMAQIDAVEIKLRVEDLRAVEIITAIRERLAETPASGVIIRADPSLALSEGRFTFAQNQIRLSDALSLLRNGGRSSI